MLTLSVYFFIKQTNRYHHIHHSYQTITHTIHTKPSTSNPPHHTNPPPPPPPPAEPPTQPNT
ncbi:hypothetical protein BofuT4_P003120.1 [Botrytis cinerea T4]|uniref:Uncharacterized protein n=1 Tax=Botryotinia fuckeliana (strain T4) TaxID=999810 RepID=G2Y3B3_BOTF4|nr:hypothetical protein BofuT4_P003120.1 [Botrytis cinerea T4]